MQGERAQYNRLLFGDGWVKKIIARTVAMGLSWFLGREEKGFLILSLKRCLLLNILGPSACRSLRMSFQAPPTLLQLAVQSLLREEALAISALQDLPRELFPRLFKEAFTRRQSAVLRAMVQVWPFPCLPLGGLMKMKVPYLETLQTILDGIDILLGQKVHPR